MVAIALSVTLLNGLLGVVLLHGNARMRDEVRACSTVWSSSRLAHESSRVESLSMVPSF